MDDIEHNKMIVREYVEAFNRGDMPALARLFTPDAVIHGILGQGGLDGLDSVMPIWREIHGAFQIRLNVDEIIGEGAHIAVRYTERGTFTVPFRGQAPTGKSYEVVAMEWFEFRDGRIRRQWGAGDNASQARQVGLPLA